MTVRTYRYPAYIMLQTPDSKPLLLFGAPASEISNWVGIPQRGKLGGGETVGFQRQESPSRVQELAGFFNEQKNVVQNPLLGALQDDQAVKFIPSIDGSQFGHIEITTDNLIELSLATLIQRVIQKLESRVPSLKENKIDQNRLSELINRASTTHSIDMVAHEDVSNGNDEENELAEEVNLSTDEAWTDATTVLLSEETQLVDFHQELIIRLDVLNRLSALEDLDSLVGFTKESMISYLEPIVLVDGQHRLSGAVRSAQVAIDNDKCQDDMQKLIDQGESANEAQARILASASRQLPVSLLMDSSPSEHVFQFVVVNQKATPIGKALLGTIVSTSLSRDELTPVAERLRRAGIRLEDSQSVAYLTRADESPFKGVVQTGVDDQVGHLPWTVLKGLTSIFRELKGGRLYHQKNDYAAKWRRRELPYSTFFDEGCEPEEIFKIWSAPDGPWRPVFIRFFTLIRERFSDEDLLANNAWGSTAKNLFNKITLTILAADYFQFLDDRRRTLNSLDDVDETVNEWLDGVDSTYFARDWRMGNLKKDQAAVQKQWASIWFEYRKDPERLPRIENYRP